MHDVDLHLMGRNTYEEMAEFWPVSDDAYAAPMNEIPKVVCSRTLERAPRARHCTSTAPRPPEPTATMVKR
jgi:dihydrofolate reductase